MSDEHDGSRRGRLVAMECGEPDWEESVSWLLELDRVPAAEATGHLLQAAVHWKDRVVARTAMHDLVFTLPGAQPPFVRCLNVAWTGSSFEFLLTADGALEAANHCGHDDALAALEEMLGKLVSLS